MITVSTLNTFPILFIRPFQGLRYVSACKPLALNCHSSISSYSSSAAIITQRCSIQKLGIQSAYLTTMSFHAETNPPKMVTQIVAVDASKAGRIIGTESDPSALINCDIEWNTSSLDFAHLQKAATLIQTTDVPVAFPTETVYGLGADARRDGAVEGIFKAKNRPSDNPLIVHFHSLNQLRELLRPGVSAETQPDPIPEIYLPLIRRFWPGPISIILPIPSPSTSSDTGSSDVVVEGSSYLTISPFTTAGLSTFGARMPSTPLCRMLLKLSGAPLAAPSANASTRPSPTQATHVLEDLGGKIEMILDGGSCDVGVESTVVDGITQGGPTILRPGSIGLTDLQSCPGWENVRIGYKNKAEGGSNTKSATATDSTTGTSNLVQVSTDSVPRAPGMKYKHYSPRARVLLYEASALAPSFESIQQLGTLKGGLGIIRTRKWISRLGFSKSAQGPSTTTQDEPEFTPTGFEIIIPSTGNGSSSNVEEDKIQAWDISLGSDPVSMARGLFSAFRDLDRLHVDIILVEGIDENADEDVGGVATAVMNRLRKAAESVG